MLNPPNLHKSKMAAKYPEKSHISAHRSQMWVISSLILGLWDTRSLLKYMTTSLANYINDKIQNGCQITKCREILTVIEI